MNDMKASSSYPWTSSDKLQESSTHFFWIWVHYFPKPFYYRRFCIAMFQSGVRFPIHNVNFSNSTWKMNKKIHQGIVIIVFFNDLKSNWNTSLIIDPFFASWCSKRNQCQAFIHAQVLKMTQEKIPP